MDSAPSPIFTTLMNQPYGLLDPRYEDEEKLSRAEILPIMDGIVELCNLTLTVRLSFVHVQFYKAALRRFDSVVRLGKLAIPEDDMGPNGETLQLLLDRFDKSKSTCVTFRLSLTKVTETLLDKHYQCIISILSRSVETLNDIWIGGGVWEIERGFHHCMGRQTNDVTTCGETERVTTSFVDGACRLTSSSSFSWNKLGLSSAMSLSVFYSFVSELLCGRFGVLQRLEILALAWPIDWNFRCRMGGPALARILYSTPNVRFVHLQNIDDGVSAPLIDDKSFDYIHETCDYIALRGRFRNACAHPLYIDQMSSTTHKSQTSAKIRVQNLERISFGRCGILRKTKNGAIWKCIHPGKIIGCFLNGTETPKLKRIDIGVDNSQRNTGDVVQVLLQFPSFPTTVLGQYGDYTCFRAKYDRNGLSKAKVRTYDASLTAFVLPGNLEEPPCPYKLFFPRTSCNGFPDHTSWIDAQYCHVYRSCNVEQLENVVNTGNVKASSDDSIRVALIVSNEINRCPQIFRTNTPIREMTTHLPSNGIKRITLVIKSVDEPSVAAIETLDFNTRALVDVICINYSCHESNSFSPRKCKMNGDYVFKSNKVTDAAIITVQRLLKVLPRLRRLRIALHTQPSTLPFLEFGSRNITISKQPNGVYQSISNRHMTGQLHTQRLAVMIVNQLRQHFAAAQVSSKTTQKNQAWQYRFLHIFNPGCPKVAFNRTTIYHDADQSVTLLRFLQQHNFGSSICCPPGTAIVAEFLCT